MDYCLTGLDEWVHGLYNLEVQDKTSLITISEVNNVSAQDTHVHNNVSLYTNVT